MPGRRPAQRRRRELDTKVAGFHRASDGVHGAPRILADLRAGGERVSRKTVAASLRRQGLAGISPRRFAPATTVVDLAAAVPKPSYTRRHLEKLKDDGRGHTMMFAEESLDPSDWDGLKALGHKMVDDMFDYLATLRRQPVWQPMPDEVKARFKLPIPHEPQGAENAYYEFQRDVLPYAMGNPHPRFWAWVMGNGTPIAMLAEMLAAGVNPNVGGASHSGNEVESQVLEWWKTALGYPTEASGLLVSGGSMANLIGLTVARNAHNGSDGQTFDVRQHGVAALPKTTYVVLLDGNAQLGAAGSRTVGVRQPVDRIHPATTLIRST